MSDAARPEATELTPADEAARRGGVVSARALALARRLVDHVLEEDGDLFARWRARLVASALLAAVTVGIVPFAITMRVLVAEGRGWLVALHLLANAQLWWMLLSRRPSNRLRSIMLVGACFTVGLLSILTMGFVSAALVWLFASILLSSLLLGVACTVATVASALLLLFGAGLAIETGHAPWLAGQPDIATRWLMITLNFAFVSLVCALGNAIVLQVLAQEEQRRQTLERRLAEARQHEALGTLASGIAHDFNNLLVPITHGLEELRSQPSLDRAAHGVLDDALGSAAVARDLVQRVLSFSRQNAHTRAVQPLAPIVHAVCARVAARHGVTPSVTVAADALVFANPAELHQIVDNLLDNALRAVEGNGAVAVRVALTRRADTDWVRLVVADTGRGMSAELVSRIFDPYFSTRPVGQGTGLGLPIVRSIVTGLDGQIAVQSAPGGGTTFEVLLPLASHGAAASASAEAAHAVTTLRMHAPPPQRTPGPVAAVPAEATPSDDRATVAERTRRVLLVDDEPLVRRAIARQLERLGYAAIACASVDEAEVALTAGPVDVVLTDWRMPGRDGFALATLLVERALAVPVVIMSGDAASARARDDWPDGVVPLQKPFSRDDLDAALTAALRRYRGNDAS